MRWGKNNWVLYIKLGNSLVKKLNETLGEGRENLYIKTFFFDKWKNNSVWRFYDWSLKLFFWETLNFYNGYVLAIFIVKCE